MAFRPSASFLSPLRLPLASSSRSLRPPPCLLSTPSSSQQLGRRAVFSMVSQPKQDVVVDGQIVNPLSAFEYDPLPPHAPLFPLYIPLFSLDPAVPPSESALSVLPLPRDIFGLPLRRDILHSCVVHHLNLLKRGTTHTKNRAEVRGSGKKLHRQKGTGRARVADSGSGIRRGGGKIHGPRYRDFSTDLPRKTRQLGFKIALSQKLREGRLRVVGPDGFVLEGWEERGKTNAVSKQFDALEIRRPLLLHSPWAPPPVESLPRSIRNNPVATLASVSSVSVFDLLRSHDVILDTHALDWLVGKVRQTSAKERADTFSGNAMVMRRRKLGLSDFPLEGEVDESKELLRLLELESGLRSAELAGEGEDAGERGIFGKGEVERELDEDEVELEVEQAEEILDRLELEQDDKRA